MLKELNPPFPLTGSLRIVYILTIQVTSSLDYLTELPLTCRLMNTPVQCNEAPIAMNWCFIAIALAEITNVSPYIHVSYIVNGCKFYSFVALPSSLESLA